jgi:protein TonB
MKTSQVLLGAALFGGLLTASSFANVVVPLDPAPVKFVPPAPIRIVEPTELLRRHAGATVTLSLTVDAAGLPHDIKIVQGQDQNLTARLLPAVAQWKFTPAMRNDTPVSAKILLPIKLVDGPVS